MFAIGAHERLGRPVARDARRPGPEDRAPAPDLHGRPRARRTCRWTSAADGRVNVPLLCALRHVRGAQAAYRRDGWSSASTTAPTSSSGRSGRMTRQRLATALGRLSDETVRKRFLSPEAAPERHRAALPHRDRLRRPLGRGRRAQGRPRVDHRRGPLDPRRRAIRRPPRPRSSSATASRARAWAAGSGSRSPTPRACATCAGSPPRCSRTTSPPSGCSPRSPSAWTSRTTGRRTPWSRRSPRR